MKICFPARKANGEQYTTVDDMMQPLCQEPHGSWLAGTNNMWHGGIHITSKSASGSVLTSETADTAVPLQFMAGGEVVAWRINQDYLTGKYINNPLQYSSTFVLVKSTCTPEPEKKDNSLDFYSLYIGLAPLSAFPEHRLYQVTDKGNGLSQREYTGQEKDGDKAPVAKNKLKTGDSVIVLRDITFDLKGQTQTFGLARMLNSKSEMIGGAFWMALDPQYVTPAGEQRAHLPAWMQQAVAQGTFDTVVKPATRLEVAAGDAVGYLAEDIAPCDLHGVEKSAFVHIEVLSTDSRMIDFLSNKAQVKSGPKYVHIHPESFIYSRSGDTFTQTKGQVKKDIHKIMPQDKCHLFTDSSGKRWFDIGDGAWVSEADVDADIGQYDLDKLGFKAFEEPSTSDMTKSLREGWIKDGFTRIAEWVRPERGIREKQVSDYYKALLRKMDSDNSGDLSGEELRHAVNYAELDVRDIAARMVVRHDSEWFGGSGHHRWRTFLKQMDPLCVSYVRQWFDDMEWMSKVDGFSSGEPVWHMHPVVFLSSINALSLPKTPVNGELVPLDFVNFYNGEVIDESDYELAANKLRCEVAAIKAVANTETGSSGSYFKFEQHDDYVPAILFERHHFHKYTGGKYDSQADISNKNAGGYGKNSVQYPKLLKAYVLDKRSALMATSWGKFQILASNYKAAGYSSPEEFVRSISKSEKNQLAAFVNFINSDSVLLKAIRNKDWLAFALRYNGPKQRGYDLRMRDNYEKNK